MEGALRVGSSGFFYQIALLLAIPACYFHFSNLSGTLPDALEEVLTHAPSARFHSDAQPFSAGRRIPARHPRSAGPRDLITNHALIASPAPIYAHWTEKSGEIPHRPQTALVYKSDATTVDLVFVLAALRAFVTALSSGATLAAALESLDDEDVADDLTTFVGRLRGTNALTTT